MSTGSVASLPAAQCEALAAHCKFILALNELYSQGVVWSAPARSVRCTGRDAVISHLLREAGGMHDPYQETHRLWFGRTVADRHDLRDVHLRRIAWLR